MSVNFNFNNNKSAATQYKVPCKLLQLNGEKSETQTPIREQRATQTPLGCRSVAGG